MSENEESPQEHQNQNKSSDQPKFKASILLRGEISEVDSEGRLLNIPLHRYVTCRTISGGTIEECHQKTEEFLEEFKKLHEKYQ